MNGMNVCGAPCLVASPTYGCNNSGECCPHLTDVLGAQALTYRRRFHKLEREREQRDQFPRSLRSSPKAKGNLLHAC